MEEIRKVSLSEQLYFRIREEIISGEIKPGQRLNTKELQTRFGVSMTPLREALLKLAQDRYIENISNSYSKVIELSDDDICSLLDLCAMYDSYALRRCMELTEDARQELILELQNSVERQRLHIQRGNDEIRQFETVFNNFHMILYMHSGNSWLVENAAQANRLLMIADNSKTNNDYPPEALEEHQRILDAIREGNCSAALEAAQFHRDQERVRFGII